jgi:hypothetical protein
MRGLFAKLVTGLRRAAQTSPPGRRGGDSLAWFGLALELLALAVTLVTTTTVFHNDLTRSFIWIAAAIASLFGALIIAVRAVKAIPSTKAMVPRKPYEYRQHVGELTHIDRVVDEGRQEIGSAHPDRSALMERLKENSGVLRTFSRELLDGRLKFCGYHLLYPLRKKAAEEIINGKVRAASELGDRALRESFAGAEYVYIGMVLGTDEHSRPHITDSLRRELAGILDGGRVKRVFARPATERGRELVEHYRFLPIGEESDIWSVAGSMLKAQLLVEMSPTVIITPEPAPHSPRNQRH